MFQTYTPKIYQKPIAQKLEALPFIELGEACRELRDPKLAQAQVLEFANTYGIKHKTWVYPQIQAFIAKWTLSRNSSDLYSPKQMLQDNVKRGSLDLGIYYFCMSDTRHVKVQSQGDGLYYCGLVPLILAAHKKMNGVKYTEWDTSELHLVVNPALYETMMFDDPHYSKDLLLEYRDLGLTTKSGQKAGTKKNPVSTFGLNGLPWDADGYSLGPGQVPMLARMIMCQTWCAHPLNRNEYMILDIDNWDLFPEPLIDTVPIKAKSNLTALPWDL